MNQKTSYETLLPYGWTQTNTIDFLPYAEQGLLPARIIQQAHHYFQAFQGDRTVLLERSGTFSNLQDLGVQPSPVVGDWCAISPYSATRALLAGVLPRTTTFSRPVLHEQGAVEGSAEVVAANVDQAAIIMDAYHDFNMHRIERFVALLAAQSIPSMLVLTKTDLLEDPLFYRVQISARLADLPVFLVDSLSLSGIEQLLHRFVPGSTTMLLGASGAGKSTLVNALMGYSVAKTAMVRPQDGRGRHTTTSRALHLLPNEALVLDTPGLRVVGMNGGVQAVEDSFSDIADLARSCHFSDCSHTGEKGCAVQKALQQGNLEQDRYLQFLRLREEASKWENHERREKERGRLLYLYRREGR
ncbi:ribosome small subunit-dependent GTPase A [Sphaerochaeta sp.]|uniref:ribosome small subunit-dependent GTPase A n=1 Tax=Sphaerochaeta sp. TaxID=1972642 RepID=UPI002FC7A310